MLNHMTGIQARYKLNIMILNVQDTDIKINSWSNPAADGSATSLNSSLKPG